ncbi:Secoisolariciresinol dehydrogenase [Bertholletia excelsa]
MNGFASHPTPKRLLGKVAIITGGASGIGKSVARLFVSHGAKVIIADMEDDLGHSLCRELNSADNVISYFHCDVTKESDLKNLIDMTVSKHGKLDIMYNNAGIAGDLDLAIAEANNENLKKVFEVNVFGAFLGAKHAAKVMIPAKRGVILFTSSVAALVAGETPHAYTVSKHAVVGLAKSLSVELGQHGIRVNCMSPCMVATPMATKALAMEDDVLEKVLEASANLKGAVPTVADMAEAALFLCSDEAKFVSGHNLVVDGGYSATNRAFSRAIQSLTS